MKIELDIVEFIFYEGEEKKGCWFSQRRIISWNRAIYFILLIRKYIQQLWMSEPPNIVFTKDTIKKKSTGEVH